jgi:hypothetical protein
MLPTSANDTLEFPARRSTRKANWAPIYIEPIVGSGERICTAVLAGDDSGFIVVPVPSLDRLSSLYGTQAQALSFANDLALNAIRDWISTRGLAAIETWSSPVEGVILGALRRGAGESLEDVARTGLLQCASLVEKLAEEDETSEASARTEVSTRRLEKLVREAVVAARPELHKRFDQQFRVNERARPTRIGFTGNRLVANFGMLVPGQLAILVNNAKAKLWDLEQLRSGALGGMFPQTGALSFELLLNRVPRDAPQYGERQMASVEEAGLELEAEAGKVQIRARQMTSPGEIATFVLEKEAA